jgi:hypothetical protein
MAATRSSRPRLKLLVSVSVAGFGAARVKQDWFGWIEGGDERLHCPV